LKLDSSGNVIWQKTYGGTYNDYASSIEQTTDGGYIVAGWTLSFGAGLGDLWVLKIDSSGNIDTSCTFIFDTSILPANSSAVITNTSSSGLISVCSETTSTATATPSTGIDTLLCAAATPVVISSVNKIGDPFRLKIHGSNFHTDVEVYIASDTTPWTNVKYKSDSLLILKKGSALKAKFPKGVPVEIKVVNGDGGYGTTTYTR